MDTINNFEFKQRKYMPVFPKGGLFSEALNLYFRYAEKLAAAETQPRKDAEAELEKLRTQLANLQRQ